MGGRWHADTDMPKSDKFQIRYHPMARVWMLIRPDGVAWYYWSFPQLMQWLDFTIKHYEELFYA